jgi:3-methyladenine DNA glycosylase/8-oxoguanine DNA glycosylase
MTTGHTPDTHTITLTTNAHVDFTYARTTYLIYPWISDGDDLVRPLRIGANDAAVAVARIRQTGPTRLRATIHVDAQVPDALRQIRDALVRCLHLDYPYDEIDGLTVDDPVLRAAVTHRGYGRGKLYPDMFEALCGVICAKRTTFRRIYDMMRNLALAFGEPTSELVAGEPVHAFPTPTMLAAASDAELRACRVGFRAKDLAAASSHLASAGYSWHEWRNRDPADVIADLLAVKGVGPYTANLVVNLVWGHGGAPHVDTYVTDIIRTLYLDDPTATPEQVAAFIDQRWGHNSENVIDFLTTDTETWAATLGKTVAVRSGARG